MPADPLALFLPPVGNWFRAVLGEPTLPQRLGWPAIAAGKNTLILAPTGSGKTLAAFLACLDRLWRENPAGRGVRVLYVSPLKALNNDVYRNLQVPLEGVSSMAARMGHPLPQLTVGLRTGDTSPQERQQLTRRPPHVLITTPESLHLILTSKARESLRTVEYVIVDEIHALCPNKRGVFLALLLERLAALLDRDFIRIGLSATQRPLDEVARYLGGRTSAGKERPVTIVDAGLRKEIDLQVVSPVETFGPLVEKSVWPSIYRQLLGYVREHRSTIVFANNRRTAERITTHLNELALGEDGAAEEEDAAAEAGATQAPDAEAARPVARAHHGSIALDVRQQTELALKEGRLPCVVATASLELGIDMGAVDLVCQVESSGNVARTLQRVGRAGHLVGQQSKGRLIPKTLPDLVEQAVVAREVLAGRVERLRVPTNCLDVLAQQVVAMVAMEPWEVPDLYGVVRQAYPYRHLSPAAFESVLEMVSGRYPSEAFRDLRPRISWDRLANRLHPLPGSQQLVLVNGGTIPDTGQYPAYVDGQQVRVGELDEEFVYERRIGDTFVLGTTAWKIQEIGADRVFVSRVEGVPAMMPFWRGEQVGRSRDLGEALGGFLRELVERLSHPDCLEWLCRECRLDANAARNLRDFVKRQLDRAGIVPTDRRVLVEAFRDQIGDWHVAILSPFGSRFHVALRLALETRLQRRFGYAPQALHHDDGLLLRFADMDEPPLDVLDDLDPATVEDDVLASLGDSALFAIRFRHNAMRALLMPRGSPDRRVPLWLQRLKARTLLQVARQHPSFPVVVETYRECLEDHLDVPRLQELLAGVRAGDVEIAKRRAETPSPFAAGLLFQFTAASMYDYDRGSIGPTPQTGIDKELLDHLVAPQRFEHLLDPRAIHQVERRLRGMGFLPRSPTEMAEWLRRLGDVATTELEGAMPGYLAELEREGRARRLRLANVADADRWVLTEEFPQYAAAFGLPTANGEGLPDAAAASEAILKRFLQTHALVGLADVQRRYPFDDFWLRGRIAAWQEGGELVAVPSVDNGAAPQWASPANLEQVQRGSLAIHRNEALTVSPAEFADFMVHWQYRHPATHRQGAEGLASVLARLEGISLPADLWERVILPSRVADYQARWLDEARADGACAWVCQSESDSGVGDLAFFSRAALAEIPSPASREATSAADAEADRVYDVLRQRGASFVVDLSQATGLPPSRVRAALWRLARRGLATNDRFDVVRRGEEHEAPAPGPRGERDRKALTRRRVVSPRPDGRWSLVPWGVADVERQALNQARLLLERHGVVTRELALLDPRLMPWRVLYEVFSRLEWAGEVRRGYYVEGLSGAQFALPEALQALGRHEDAANEPALLLNSLDPANAYGGGAPFELPWPAQRRPGNWLAIRKGRPLFWLEQNGRRITTLASAAEEDVALGVRLLPELFQRGGGSQLRGKLVIDEWNGQPVTATPGKEFLEAAGFVRDYQAMTLYAGWS